MSLTETIFTYSTGSDTTSSDVTLTQSSYDRGRLLTNVTVGTYATAIGDDCFESRTTLTDISISNTVLSIGAHAFDGCTLLPLIVIPDNVTTLGEGAFIDCTGLVDVDMSPNVTTFPVDGFNGCSSLTTFNFESGVTSIGANCFTDCTSLPGVVLPESITAISANAFSNCTSLAYVYTYAATIGPNAFQSCIQLTNLVLYYGVVTLSDSCFNGCTTLNNVLLPGTVTTLQFNCFGGCLSLDTFGFLNQSSLTTVGSSVFVADPAMTVTYYQTANFAALSAFSQSLQTSGTVFPADSVFLYDASKAVPTLSGFPDIEKELGNPPFTLTQPTSNSSGTFGYSSDDSDVATVSGDVCTIVGVGTCTITADQSASPDFQSGSIPAELDVTNPICFPPETLIQTDQGEIAIMCLHGEIHTIDGKPILGAVRTVSSEPNLVHIQRGSLTMSSSMDIIPDKNTIISSHHGIVCLDEVTKKPILRRAHELVGVHAGFSFIEYNRSYLYNVLMADHDVMTVNGMLVETLNPNNVSAKLYMHSDMNAPDVDCHFEENMAQKVREMNYEVVLPSAK